MNTGRTNLAALPVALVLALALESCCCHPHSSRLCVTRGTPAEAPFEEEDFRTEINPPLTCLAKLTGFATTPFKRAGLLGWRDYGVQVVAEGEVKQAAYSSDGFLTVDLQLSQLALDGQLVSFSPPRFLRAEICTRPIRLAKADRPCLGDRVRISGRLKWDGDGFLEVHPQRREDFEVLEPRKLCSQSMGGPVLPRP